MQLHHMRTSWRQFRVPLRRLSLLALAALLLLSGISALTVFRAARATPGDDPTPVLLVHGFDDTCDEFQPHYDPLTHDPGHGLAAFLSNNSGTSGLVSVAFSDVRTVGWYNDSTHHVFDTASVCTVPNIEADPHVSSKCVGYLTDVDGIFGTQFGTAQTLDDPIEHVACA